MKKVRMLSTSLLAVIALNPVFAQDGAKIHTNMVYDAAAAPNGGVEVSLGKNWSVGADGWIAWVSNQRHNEWWQNYGFDVYGRYWFGAKHDKPLTGYHVGIYAGTFTYDIYPEGKGYQCDKMFHTFRTGAEIGYAVPAGKHFIFDCKRLHICVDLFTKTPHDIFCHGALSF